MKFHDGYVYVRKSPSRNSYGQDKADVQELHDQSSATRCLVMTHSGIILGQKNDFSALFLNPKSFMIFQQVEWNILCKRTIERQFGCSKTQAQETVFWKSMESKKGMAEEEGFEPSVEFAPTPVFKTGAFDHSATPPQRMRKLDQPASNENCPATKQNLLASPLQLRKLRTTLV